MAKEKAVATSTNAVKKETVNKKPGLGKRVKKWWRERKSELKKVIWPTPKQTVKNTVVALVVMLVSAVVIWGFDKVAELIVNAVITLAG